MKGFGWAPGVQVLRRQQRREETSLNESIMIKSSIVPCVPLLFFG